MITKLSIERVPLSEGSFNVENDVGSLLSSADFLSYHDAKKHRIFEQFAVRTTRGNLHGWIPFSVQDSEAGSVLTSHAGTTFAGLQVSADDPSFVQDSYAEILTFLESQFKCIEIQIRLPPSLIRPSVDVHEWALWSLGFAVHRTFLGRQVTTAGSVAQVNRNRRRNISRGRARCVLVPMSGYDPTVALIIEENRRRRHDVSPTHTAEDFVILQQLLGERFRIWGAYHDGKPCAIAVVFAEETHWTVQYLAGHECSLTCGSQDFLVSELMSMAESVTCKHVLFGTSTEPHLFHKELNLGLDAYKKSLGGRPYAYRWWSFSRNS